LCNQLSVQRRPIATDDCCGLCGRPVVAPPGALVALAENDDPVCLECTHRHEPALAALVRLGLTAERVGRIGRHGVFPPLTALLDLARAAESYTSAAGPWR
jgi:hypothetical protein